MLYIDYLKQISGKPCTFCNCNDRKFLENESAFLTYNLAPYHRHHLLVIPKSHSLSFRNLARPVFLDIWELIKKGADILTNLGYEDFTVIVREGNNGAKSVEHLHYHLIPNSRIGDVDHNNEERKIMSKEEIEAISKDVLSVILKAGI